MRYDDLDFVLHAEMSAVEAMVAFLPFSVLSGGRSIHEPRGAVRIERAEAAFPNGRSLSILRGMRSIGARGDFETCRMDAEPLEPIRHETIESVQEEMDAVAALPPTR